MWHNRWRPSDKKIIFTIANSSTVKNNTHKLLMLSHISHQVLLTPLLFTTFIPFYTMFINIHNYILVSLLHGFIRLHKLVVIALCPLTYTLIDSLNYPLPYKHQRVLRRLFRFQESHFVLINESNTFLLSGASKNS